MIGLGLQTAPDRVMFALGLGEIGRDPRIATGLAATALDVTGRVLQTATDRADSICDPLLVGEVVVTVLGHAIPLTALVTGERSRVWSLPSSDRSRSKEGGRRARRERQEGVETVAVSKAPVVSEASATVAPPVGDATVAALPSVVQDLTRFFLSLAGSSSLGAVGGVTSATAPSSGVGAQLCPSTLGGGAVASSAATAMPAGAVDSPAAHTAVPGSSGRQQRQEVSRSSRRRRRSSSDGTGRSKKKRTRDRSPSPGRSSRRREKSYRSSSESFPGGEGIWRLETRDLSLSPERVRPSYSVQDGNSRFCTVICQGGDFLASLGIKDAYFQIPIHPSSRKLLSFTSKGTVYQFQALCFRLSTAPQVFNRVFAAVSVWVHSHGIRLLRYLDNWLILASSEQEAKQAVQSLLSLCRTLGIVINMKKSDLLPSQTAKYLGMTIDTEASKVFLSLA